MPKLPVLFLTFNKTAPTAQVLATLQAYAPERLYIAQDGPRADRPEEVGRVAEVRKLLHETESWPCQTHYRHQDTNLGLQRHVESAISWFFEHEPEGIILEDDTVPSPDFFRFCEELIERYREDRRVMMIGGCNLNLVTASSYSYFFSTHPLIWGWATWRDRWAHYDGQMRAFEQMDKDGTLPLAYPDAFRRETELSRVQDLKSGRSRSWGFRWAYTLLAQHGLCIVPGKNMVVNVGFGEEGTNALDADHPSAQLQLELMPWPLIHPPYMVRSAEWENRFFYPGQHFHRYHSLGELASGLWRKLKDKLRRRGR